MTIDERGACERHVTVTVSREDIDRYFDNEFSELMTSAQVPGFRVGHAPRRLIEARFRKDVADRVKSALLMDSIGQVNEREDLSPISEPDFTFEAVELPDEGPMTFEFDLEVRPEFDVPEWKGLKIEPPGPRIHRRGCRRGAGERARPLRPVGPPFRSRQTGRLYHHEPLLRA